MARMGTATANLGANLRQSEYFERQFIKTLDANLVFVPLGVESTLPEKNGLKARWVYFTTMASQTTFGDEGADPPANAFTTSTAEATIMEWGAYTDFSRMFMDTAVSGTMEKFIDGNAQQAARTLDTRVQLDALASATNTNDAGTALTAEDIRTASSELHTNNAKYHPSTPGGNFYCFVGTPAALFDMVGEGAPAWFQAKSSDLQGSFVTPMRGTPATAGLYDVICKSSTNIETSSSNDVMYMLGDEAFGVVGLGNSITGPGVVITRPEELVSAPVRNRGTVGWWILWSCTMIDANRFVEILADT